MLPRKEGQRGVEVERLREQYVGAVTKFNSKVGILLGDARTSSLPDIVR